jgi:hypothetical protein
MLDCPAAKPMLDGAPMIPHARTTFRLAALAALLVGVPAARAGSISITMTATADVKDGNLVVGLTIGNTGDEAASSVVPVLRVGDKEVRGQRHESLDPGQKVQDTLGLPTGDLTPGRWPYRLAVDYTDANQYPFQALHAATFLIGSPPPAKVAVPEISVPALSDRSTVSLTVKNLAGVARSASVSVFAPEGLEVETPTQKVDLPAWETAKVRATLVNRTALAGSRYPIFVAVEYDEDGTHQALAASGTVEVQQRRALVSRGLLWVVGALLVAWVALLIWRRGRA